MVPNDLPLPPSFVTAVRRGSAQLWVPRFPFDRVGHPLPGAIHFLCFHSSQLGGLGSPYEPERLRLAADQFMHGLDAWKLDRGFVPYPSDYARVVQIGYTGSGDRLCLDYREHPQNPSVIYWDGVFWRRIAPDFEAFECLFMPWDINRQGSAPRPAWGQEHAAVIAAALQSVTSYDIWRSDVLVHIVYPTRHSPTVVVLPLGENGSAEGQPRSDGALRVTVPLAAHLDGTAAAIDSPRVWPQLASGSDEEMLGQAAAAAVGHASSRFGSFEPPVILKTRQIGPRGNEAAVTNPGSRKKPWVYGIWVSEVHEIIGGTSFWALSEDLMEATYKGGA